MPNVIGQLDTFGDFALCFTARHDHDEPHLFTAAGRSPCSASTGFWPLKCPIHRGVLWNGWERDPLAEMLPHFIAHADNAAKAIGRRTVASRAVPFHLAEVSSSSPSKDEYTIVLAPACCGNPCHTF